jgi:type IV pilus assembly protein PilC
MKSNISTLKISTNDKLSMVSNLATMLNSGIPILETIKSLSDESKGNVKKLLDIVHEDLKEGNTLSNSFSKFPQVFSRININILKSAEQSGSLEDALKDLRQSIRRETEFSDKIKAALLYPLILLVVFAGMFLMILLFVIPRIAAVFSNLRVVLPLPTKIMIAISHALTTNTLPVSLGLGVIVISLIYLYQTKRKSFLITFSKIPVISQLFREIDLTRFTHSLSILLTSGVPLPVAIDLCRDVVISSNINRAIYESREIIMAGGKLSEGLKNNQGSIPGIMIKIIESGEKTGTLDKAMNDVSEYLDYNVVNGLKTATTLLEPVILVAVGVFLGGMMLAIIAPIYNLISQINAQ